MSQAPCTRCRGQWWSCRRQCVRSELAAVLEAVWTGLRRCPWTGDWPNLTLPCLIAACGVHSALQLSQVAQLSPGLCRHTLEETSEYFPQEPKVKQTQLHRFLWWDWRKDVLSAPAHIEKRSWSLVSSAPHCSITHVLSGAWGGGGSDFATQTQQWGEPTESGNGTTLCSLFVTLLPSEQAKLCWLRSFKGKTPSLVSLYTLLLSETRAANPHKQPFSCAESESCRSSGYMQVKKTLSAIQSWNHCCHLRL